MIFKQYSQDLLKYRMISKQYSQDVVSQIAKINNLK